MESPLSPHDKSEINHIGDVGASQSVQTPRRESASIPSLPTELAIKVFMKLDTVASACLGLTCKAYHSIHRTFYGNVILSAFGLSCATLPLRLKCWIPRELAYSCVQGFLISPVSEPWTEFDGLHMGALGDFEEDIKKFNEVSHTYSEYEFDEDTEEELDGKPQEDVVEDPEDLYENS